MSLDILNCDDWSKIPRLKIFFGADIVGSTALKQPFDPSDVPRSIERARAWENIVTKFYSDSQVILQEEWSKLVKIFDQVNDSIFPNLAKTVCGPRPHFWKSLGDEVLFWKECTHPFQVRTIVICWMNTLARIRENLGQWKPRRSPSAPSSESRGKKDDDDFMIVPSFIDLKGLDVKSSVWSAEFPVRNRILPANAGSVIAYESSRSDLTATPKTKTVDRKSDELISSIYRSISDSDAHEDFSDGNAYRGNASRLDFIGPGIDTGFRIASFATKTRMALSVDVAFMLSHLEIWRKRPTEDDASPGIEPDELQRLKRHLANVSVKGQYNTYKREKDRIPAEDLWIHFSGTDYLKGVLGGIKYPKFWIDTTKLDTFESKKEALYIIDKPRQKLMDSDIKNFCISFYDDRQKFITPPQTFSYEVEASKDEGFFNARYRPADFITDHYMDGWENNQGVYADALRHVVDATRRQQEESEPTP